ncbi:MAG: SDR family oxidoreductase [Acidithiobacillus sp.]|nr:SDR family oxidoreductase [Acidithiobacillus sp.]MDD5576239.1 SDR family oxidoreductase [Acidithiobacillus sp.]
MQVLVTGAAGHTAAALLPALLAWPYIRRIIALDRRPPALRHPKLYYLPLDIRDPQLAKHLTGVDCVIHLAFMVLSPRLGPQQRWRAEMRQVNLDGSQHLFLAAADAGVPQVIYSGSVAAYGAWPDNPVPIGENQPCRPVPGFAYSEDKAALEQWLDGFTAAQKKTAVTRLRLHAIIGPHGQALVNEIATSPYGLRLSNPDLPIQCLHEDDAASAILAALRYGQDGIFNIAAPDPIPWSSIPRRWQLPLSPTQLHGLHRWLRPLSTRLGDPGWLQVLENPLIVDISSAWQKLKWQPRYDVRRAIDQVRDACGQSPIHPWSG